jgi:hypothetical protein
MKTFAAAGVPTAAISLAQSPMSSTALAHEYAEVNALVREFLAHPAQPGGKG